MTLRINLPMPYAPVEELRAFILECEASEYRDRHEVQHAVDEVRQYLRIADWTPGLSQADREKAYNEALLDLARTMRARAKAAQNKP